MIKDTFFCMPRFINVCRKEMVENWKSNMLRIILLYGVMAVVMVWNGYFVYRGAEIESTDSTWSFLLVIFMWALWGFGCLSASFTMEKMKSKTGRISVLMTPATPFEKFFSRWLLSTVVYLLVFIIAYRLADYTRVLVYSLVYPELKFIAPVKLCHIVGENEFYTIFKDYLELGVMLASYIFGQSCFTLGSAIWPKNSFLKTFAAGTIITILYITVATILSKMLIANGMVAFPHILTSMPQYFFLKLVLLSCSLFALLNWVLAYFRFKESEIINRM